jgi:hypothetical protein
VKRSPDTNNFADGGSLLFRAGNAEPTWAAVADFTNYTAWYYNDSIIGGVGGWVDALGMALGAPLTLAPCRTNSRDSKVVQLVNRPFISKHIRNLLSNDMKRLFFI